MVRTITGYLFVFGFLPILVYFLSNITTEVKQVQSLHQVLDNHIHLQEMELSQSSYILDGEGEIISEVNTPVNRIYVSSEKIPSFLKQIFITSEDQNFFTHPGFDLTAMTRALAVNIQSQSIEEGASTITQQLARHLYLNTEQTYNRKLSEILYAYQLERSFSKDEILELYLNTIYFNHGAYGVEAAANTYFQKSIHELTLAEQAFIAAIPNNPSLYNPVSNFEKTKARQTRLIDQMEEAGFLNHEEAKAIKDEPIELKLNERIDLYPDYVTYVEKELWKLIAISEGFAEDLSNITEELEKKITERVQEVISSGIIIKTSLNRQLQEHSLRQLEKYLPYEDIQGAIVVIDHKNGEIVSLIGGKQYKKYDFHRAFQAYRQPGSSIKTILVYAPYIERTRANLNEQINADEVCYNGYCPKNYGGGIYGMVSLERAFIHSYNTPAVRILNDVGIEEAFQDLVPFHFQKVTKRDHVLPAAIGGFTYGMTPLELTRAYTVFANGGFYKEAMAIREVTDLNGKVLYTWGKEAIPVWRKDTIEKMRTLLHKVVTSGTGKKAYFSTEFIGGKTGTTNNYQDYWFVGLTANYTAGVWIGKDKPENIKFVESKAPHLHIWREILSEVD